MPVETVQMFGYIAHIQREDGSVVELTGDMESLSPNGVYQWLLIRAKDLNGYLVSQNIQQSDKDVPGSTQVPNTPVKQLPAPAEKHDKPTVPTIFGDGAVFGEYKDTYGGSSLVTYKVTKEIES